jgi:hypothetical protein
MEIMAYRMSNGDEIMGRGVPGIPSSDRVFLTKVRHLIVQRTAEGLGVTLMPWAFSNIDTEVTLFKAHIAAEYEPSAETIASYLQQTTGIALTSA